MANKSATTQRPQKVAQPRRGEIYLVRLDPTVGAEIQKTRPALVIQNDIANRVGSLTIVAPITSRFGRSDHPSHVVVEAPSGGLAKPSVILCTQIRTVDKSRLLKRLGRIPPIVMEQVDQALMISLGLIEL